MDFLFIDIYDEYYDWSSMEIIGIQHRYGGIYKINRNQKDVENDLYNLIMTNKNDGIQIETDVIENIFYTKVFLFLDRESIENKYNIDYIKEYLNNNYEYIEKVNINNIQSSNAYIFIEYSWDDIENIRGILEKIGVHDYFINKSSVTFEKGANDYREAILIGLGTGLATELIKYCFIEIKNYIVKRDTMSKVSIGIIDIDKIQRELSNITKENLNGLYISELKKYKKDNYEIILKTRYAEFICICDGQANIKDLKVHRYTKTGI